jgi:hypothetical protein
MRVRHEQAWEKALRFERWAMRKALRRVQTAERWVSLGEKIDERLLSLAWHWNQVQQEEAAKKKNLKRVAP